MNLFQHLVNYFTNKNSEVTQSTSENTPTGYEVSNYGGDTSTKKTKFLEAMRSWTYASVSAIADEVAKIEIRLFEKKGDEIIEIKEHPILDVLSRVNDFTTQFDHFWLTQSYLELTGESPWFIVKNEQGEPEEIYFLRPDRIQPLTSDEHLLSGYKYMLPNGDYQILAPEDVIFLKYPNPANPFRGKGTLEAAALTVDIDDASEKWNYNFYNNSARPDIILKVNNEQMSKEQKDVLKKSLKDSHQGVKKAHKTMVLFGNMEIEKLGFNMKDMDFNNQLEFGRNKIIGMFKVPKIILAQTDGVNYATAKASKYVFDRYTIEPKMERIIQQLNEFYLPMFTSTENMFLDYTSPVKDDEEILLKKYDSGLKNGWLTINEVRNFEGLDPIEGLDNPHLPLNLVQVGKNFTKRLRQMRARNKNVINFDNKVNKIKDNIKTIIKNELMNKNGKEENKKIEHVECDCKNHNIERKHISKKENVYSDEKNLQFWQMVDNNFKIFEPKIEKTEKDIFERQEKETLKKLDKQKSYNEREESLLPRKIKQEDIDIDELLLDEKKEQKKQTPLLLPIFTALYVATGNSTLRFLGEPEKFDVDNEETRKLLLNDTEFLIKNTVGTTNLAIKEQITIGISEGEGIRDLQKRIKNVFKDATDVRAKMISVTETARYNSNATEQAFKQSGIVEGKMWQVDTNPCPQCIALQGKIVSLGRNFLKKGDSINDIEYDYTDTVGPPLHPNCRCSLVPVFKEAKSEKPKVIKEIKREVKVVVDNRGKKEYDKQIKNYKEINKELDKEKLELEEKKNKINGKIKELENEIREVKKDKEKSKEEIKKELNKLKDEKDKLSSLRTKLIKEYSQLYE